MAYASSQSEWGTVAKTLHWLMGILIICQLIMGWVFTFNIIPGPTQNWLIMNGHVPMGITILGLVAIRLLWRLSNVSPALPANMVWWERLLASGAQTSLYFGMIVLPLSGWIALNAFGAQISWFFGVGLPSLAVVEAKETGRPLTVLFAQTHYWVAVVVSAAVLGHVAGALRHHFGKKDDVLVRMAPKGWVKLG